MSNETSSQPTTSSPAPSTNPPPPSSPTTPSPSSDDDTTLPPNRFELELEFLQCLASPAYLHHLATSGLFTDPSFLAFLRYLRYWKQPPYSRFVIYPNAFYFLDLLTSSDDSFRREMTDVGFRNFVHEQQFYNWQYRSRNLYGMGIVKDENEDEEEEEEEGDGEEDGKR